MPGEAAPSLSVRLIGRGRKASALSFILEGHRPLYVGKALDRERIAVCAGHHCAQPILRRVGLEATVRPSLAFYNTAAESGDENVSAVRKVMQKARRALSEVLDNCSLERMSNSAKRKAVRKHEQAFQQNSWRQAVN